MGIRVGMGVDGEAGADLADPFENMRTGLYAIHDKYEDATVMSPYQVLWLRTMGSADVLNVKDKLGSLEPGKFADFLLINPRSLGVSLEDPTRTSFSSPQSVTSTASTSAAIDGRAQSAPPSRPRQSPVRIRPPSSRPALTLAQGNRNCDGLPNLLRQLCPPRIQSICSLLRRLHLRQRRSQPCRIHRDRRVLNRLSGLL